MIEPTKELNSIEEIRNVLDVNELKGARITKAEDEKIVYNQFYREEKQIYKKNEISFMDFSNFDNAWKCAEMISKARCIPKEFQGNPSDILVAIQFGHDLGMKPMTSLQNIMIVNNKPSIYGDAMLAVCMAFPDFIDCIESYDSETQQASCTVKRKGREPLTRIFNRKMAESARLWGKVSSTGIPSPWVTSPERMLQFRARGFALRDMFPDVLKGMPTVEEMRDVESFNESKFIESKSTSDSMKERLKAKQSENLLTSSKKDIL